MVIQGQNVKICIFQLLINCSCGAMLEMQRSCNLLLFKGLLALARLNLKDLALVCFKELQSPTSRVWAMFQFPLAEQNIISSRACDDFQGWGVLSLATPVLKFGETNEFSYVVGNQSGWVGKLTQNFLNPFDLYQVPLSSLSLSTILDKGTLSASTPFQHTG